MPFLTRGNVKPPKGDTFDDLLRSIVTKADEYKKWAMQEMEIRFERFKNLPEWAARLFKSDVGEPDGVERAVHSGGVRNWRGEPVDGRQWRKTKLDKINGRIGT